MPGLRLRSAQAVLRRPASALRRRPSRPPQEGWHRATERVAIIRRMTDRLTVMLTHRTVDQSTIRRTVRDEV